MLPELRFSDSIVLPTYIVFLSLLFTVIIILIPVVANKSGRNVYVALNTALVVLLVGFVGARLFHVFYEEWPLYSHQPVRILYVWLGGFVWLGGAVPGALAMFLYLRSCGESFDDWADFFTPFAAIGYGLGRLSCFFSGCCYGIYCDLPWSIDQRHPTQLYAVAWELMVAAVLIWNRQKVLEKLGVGGMFWVWIFAHAAGRTLMESFRADFRGPLVFGFSVSTAICLSLISLSVSQIILRISKE
jgi:phosphatidylglycerol:prolipoprotein diacylglycerol transferase